MNTRQARQIAEHTAAALVGWRLSRLRSALDGPLAVVATGATLGLATLWARLHETTGQPAWSLTPADFEQRPLPRGARVLLLSATGRHHDILGAARRVLRLREAGTAVRLHAVVHDGSAPLCDLVRAAGGDVTVLPAPPAPQDLADPHVALPMLVLAGTLYGGLAPGEEPVMPAPNLHLPAERPAFVICLGSGLAAPAAWDFAARCREAGLAHAFCGDRRNAAHGDLLPLDVRRSWLVHFALPEDARGLGAYDRHLPPALAVTRVLAAQEGPKGALALFTQGLFLFRTAAERYGATPSIGDLPDWIKALYRQAEE